MMSHRGSKSQPSRNQTLYNTKTLVDASNSAAKEGSNKLDSHPVRPVVNSEKELESLDISRHQEYKLYWHFQEFNPVDLQDHLDIDEKYKQRQKMEKVLEKFRNLPESVHISKFLKYEKLNLKT